MLINCHSWFSLKYGTISPENLLQELAAKGYTTAALTDINNTSANIEFVRLAGQYNIRPVLGIDFRNGIDLKYIGLAKNNEGLRALNEHLTNSQQNGGKFDDIAPRMQDTIIIYPFKNLIFRQLNDNEFIGIKSQNSRKLLLPNGESTSINWLCCIRPLSDTNAITMYTGCCVLSIKIYC